MVFIRFRRIPCEAQIWVADDFVDADEIGELLALVGDGASWGAQHDETGRHFELPIGAHPALGAINRRLDASLGFANAHAETLRFRRYGPGERHDPHLDCFDWGDGTSLVATAMVCLRAPEAGGETRFAAAGAGAVRLAPMAGRVAVWLNYLSDGRPDPASRHQSMPVLAGEKTTLTAFVYADRRRRPVLARGTPATPDIPGVAFETAA